jgi:hypothetical protein
MADRAKARPKVTTDTIDACLEQSKDILDDNHNDLSSMSSDSQPNGQAGNDFSVHTRKSKDSHCPSSSKKKVTQPQSSKKRKQKDGSSTDNEDESPVEKFVKKNEYLQNKQEMMVEKHKLERMEQLMVTKEKMEARGLTKDKIIKLVPELEHVYNILED